MAAGSVICRSWVNQDEGNSEALEFLGDAVLGLVVTSYIFYCLGADRVRAIEPDQLHLLRAAIVKNDTLAFMAVSHGLHRSLLHSSVSLGRLIKNFTEVRSNGHDAGAFNQSLDGADKCKIGLSAHG